MDEKRQRKIGNARIGRDACLAWADKLICGVCAEVCPYSAIELVDDPKGVPMPFVHTDRCRGCGACQNACPATRLGKAIVVDGVSAQMALGVSDMAPWRSKGA